LAIEGILVPNNFNNFDNNGLDAIFTNLAKPLKVQAICLADRQAGSSLEIMVFEVSAKSKMRLKGAMKIAKFYENIDWTLDPDNMTWVVIKRFLEQWRALMEHKKEDVCLPPKLTKSSPVHKWLESMGLSIESWGLQCPPFLCCLSQYKCAGYCPSLSGRGASLRDVQVD
jgi:hypothetical protein